MELGVIRCEADELREQQPRGRDCVHALETLEPRSPEVLAVCGRAGLLDRPIDLGRLVHLAIPTPWGCELHSRFWSLRQRRSFS